MAQSGPSILDRTARFEPTRPFEPGRARERQRLLAAYHGMDGSQRATSHAYWRVRQNADAVSGETPATQAAAARVSGCYGCAIVLRTLWYHPHPRGWTRAAARRRGAAAHIRQTVTATMSSAANIQAGARALVNPRGPTWMSRRVGEGLCSSGDEELRRPEWWQRGEANLRENNETGSPKWVLHLPLMLTVQGIDRRRSHRCWRRRGATSAELGEIPI